MDAFNLKPCREIGTIKSQIKEAILEGSIKNEASEAFDLMQKIGKELGLNLAKG